MIKAVEILKISPFKVVCRFNTGEIKQIELESVINNSNQYVNKKKLLDEEFFKQVSIGVFGELYWENAAYFKNENGELIPCEYDLSPEFVYYNSCKI